MVRLALPFALALSGLVMACGPTPRTTVMVRISAHDDVRGALASLSVGIYARAGGRWVERFSAAPVGAERLLWPVEVAVVPHGTDDTEFEVLVTAWDAADRLLTQARVVSRVVPEATRVLPVELKGACITLGTCGERESCHGSTCRACNAAHGQASCAPAGVTETAPASPWVAQGDVEVPVAYGIAQAGDACAHEGDRACTRHGGRSALRCDGQTFQTASTCAVDEVCESRVGSKLGTCRELCSQERRDESYCADGVLILCSVDGVREQKACETGHSCAMRKGKGWCEDIDECALGTDACDAGTCENKPGSYACTCPDGYQGTGTTLCEPLMECRNTDGEGHAPCWPGLCVEEIPSYSCDCPLGYSGEGETECLEIDECSEPGACLDGSCRNLVGRHECTCPGGLVCPGALACARYAGDAPEYCEGRFVESPMPNVEFGLPNYDADTEESVSGLSWRSAYSSGYDDMRIACGTLASEEDERWHVPSLVEAITQLRLRLDSQTSDFCSWSVWTSTRVPGADRVFVVSRRFGTVVQADPKDASKTSACCVARKHSAAQAGPRVTLSTGTVSYAQTGLRWARKASTPLPFDEASTFCAELSLDGYDDFRLPSSRELYSVIDAAAEDAPWFDPAVFSSLAADSVLWSQSRELMDARFALHTGTLELAAHEPRKEHLALCVRWAAPEQP